MNPISTQKLVPCGTRFCVEIEFTKRAGLGGRLRSFRLDPHVPLIRVRPAETRVDPDAILRHVVHQVQLDRHVPVPDAPRRALVVEPNEARADRVRHPA